MKMKKTALIVTGLVVVFLFPIRATSQGQDEENPCVPLEQSPRANVLYECYDYARNLALQSSYPRLSRIIRKLLAQPRNDTLYYLEIAELMKWAGNPRAEDYYRKVIESDKSEPAVELFFADYLRNHRGPLKPLFPRAEAHYFEALRKVARLKSNKKKWSEETASRIERGLIALYQEEGIPVRGKPLEDWIKRPERPLFFLSSINKVARATGDFDNLDDIRAFTSEALLAAQRRAEYRLPSLTKDDFSKIIRVKPQYETLDRLRFRYKEVPAFEFFYRKRGIEQGAITAFETPDQTNDVRINREYGIAMEKPFSLPGGFDFFVRGGYSQSDRTGLIENAPANHEIINQYEARFAVSRFIGPDKAIFQAVYVYQDIKPKLDKKTDISKRDRQIASGKFTYDLLRKFKSVEAHDPNEKRFGLYGWNFFAGVAYDNERFGSVILRKNDYFSGSELKGIKSGLKGHSMDLSYQATVLTSEVTGNSVVPSAPLTDTPSLSSNSSIELGDLVKRQNIQLRQNASLLFRVKDEEREPAIPPDSARWLHPAFVHIVLAVKYDTALDRHKEFENYRFGFVVDSKLYSTGFRGTSFLVSAGYSRQTFFNLGKSLNLASAGFSVGF
jgi:hypothetical protein